MAHEPNHVCKNPKCNKNYWACDDCDKNKGVHWRSLCCSVDCFKEYLRAIEERDNPVKELEITEEKEVEQNETNIVNKRKCKK